jgi:hypothetical protein
MQIGGGAPVMSAPGFRAQFAPILKRAVPAAEPGERYRTAIIASSVGFEGESLIYEGH